MKIRSDRKALAEALTWVAQAVPRGPSLPALSGIRLSAAGDTLTLSAFDYDVAHQARLSVEVGDEGECLASASFLRAFVGALPGKHVELTADDTSLEISSGRSNYRTQTMALADYPNLPEVPATAGVVDGDQLASAVSDAVGPVDDAAPAEGLRGLRLAVNEDGLQVVGLSSSMLIRREVDWTGEDLAATVPGKAISAAIKGMAGEVSIGVDESAVGISDAGRTVTIRRLAGEFADWTKVLRPASQDRFGLVVERDELLDALKRAAIVAKEAKDESAVMLVIEEDSIELAAAAGHAGGREVLEAQSEGRERINFAPNLLLTALAAMEPGPLRLGLGQRRTHDIAAFMTVRPVDGDNREAVVAPRRGGEAL